MRRPLLSLLISTLALVSALAQAQPTQDLPWVLLHEGEPMARFVEHHDNAAACSQARFERGRMNADNAWRCLADVPAQVEADAAGAPLERDASDIGASVVIHSKNTNPPRYPPEAFRHGIQGEAQLAVHVNGDGSIARIEIAASTGHPDLDAAAVAAAGRWVYRPAMIGGRPAAGTVSIPVAFALN